MSTTYRAIEVTRPGALNLVQRLLPEPGQGQVQLRVEACLPLGFGDSGWEFPGYQLPACSWSRGRRADRCAIPNYANAIVTTAEVVESLGKGDATGETP